MTAHQKNEITRLRKSGMGYMKIAQALSISENTIKSFCRRNDLTGSGADLTNRCEYCDKTMGETNQAVKRFCSTACRMAWWKEHPESLNRKAVYRFICPQCNQAFDAYGNSKRRYCSRACFALARRTCHD
ncbi:MAG: helix-turn-helix transcriptional regulator [Clostridiales bacterium]|nr:helix-turn-helix transcriptional regulator [Clostridiales bacterium]